MKNYYSDSSIFYHQEPFEGEDYLSGATNISIYSSELPVWLKKAKSLKYLSINSDGIDTLPLWLKDLNTLEEIEIDCQNEATSKMKIFPKEIFEIKQVKKLKINRSGLQELPPITGAYENVDLLNNSGLDNRQVLEALCHAPNLVDYTLPSSMSLKYSYGKANPEVYYFDKFFKSVCKKRAKLKTEGLQVKEVQILKNLFYKSGLEQYSKEDFLPILNSSVGKYRQMVLEHLNESFNTVLGAKQSIAILGKISVPKKEYKEWLLNANQLYEKKTNSADYLIIGEKPGDLDAINGKNIIFESDIWDQSKGKHLDEAPPQVAENLLELMQNPDPDNLNIALLMMEKGGVPREVYEDLIGTMLFHTNNKIRKKSRTIFERHVSLDLPQNAEKQLAKNAYRIKDDKNVTKFLDLLVEGTELDISKIAYAAYRSSDKIQGQGICLQSKEIASFILYDYVDNKWVSLEPQGYLSEGLFLRTLPSFETLAGKVQGIRLDIKGHLKVEEASEFLKLNVFKNIDLNIGFARKIPETVFQNPTVEEMYFVAYRAKKLPKTIGELKNVKKLRMFVSYATAIPKEIGHLKQLEELSISSFAGKTLPVEIFELPALKELYVSGDQISTEYNLELKNICKAKGVIFRSK